MVVSLDSLLFVKRLSFAEQCLSQRVRNKGVTFGLPVDDTAGREGR